MRRLSIDAAAPEPDVLAIAAEVVARGGIIAIPTDTLYGLAVNPFDEAAVTRLFDIKGRMADQPIPLIAADRRQVVAQLGALSAAATRLADRYWPGPLTVLLPAPATLAAGVSAGTGRVGVRVPGSLVAQALCAVCDCPLTATSANLSGRPPCDDPDDVASAIGSMIDALIDAGRTPGGPPSTIVDLGGPVPVLVRAGAIPWEEVLRCLGDA